MAANISTLISDGGVLDSHSSPAPLLDFSGLGGGVAMDPCKTAKESDLIGEVSIQPAIYIGTSFEVTETLWYYDVICCDVLSVRCLGVEKAPKKTAREQLEELWSMPGDMLWKGEL